MLLLILTALLEAATGLALLAWPSLPLGLLLGLGEFSPETLLIARIAGAALLALGVACWPTRSDQHGAARTPLLLGILTYDVLAAVLLAYAGVFLHLAGLALWPGVVLHSALAVWCVVCLLLVGPRTK